MPTETPEKASKRRRLIFGLISSPLFVAIVGGISMEWYRSHFEKAPPPAPPPLPRVAIVAKFNPSTGTFRKNFLEMPEKYTSGILDVQLTNQGEKPSEDLYLWTVFSDDISVDGLSGFWAFEYKDHDGTFRPIDKKQNWEPEDHIVVIHLQHLNPGIVNSLQVVFYYETGKPTPPPTITCSDGTPATYEATWQKP